MAATDVTVIVPVYNTMPYLTRTLESLVSQTIGRGRMHVVAVDDGSTDGSGDELERYATARPDLFTVRHQRNSGGPATPCNVGLELAEGRYVYFLGADDYLGEEALERMVTAADQWGSDVLCGRVVGVGDRFVSQRLYRRDEVDLPFPSQLLATSLSNVKLFRRSMLEKHAIRYPLNLRVGSDQPFTIAAMLAATRISVLASYTCYYGVKREASDNISYSSPWRSRLQDITAIMDFVADLVEPGPERDDILWRHFDSELAKLLQRDHPGLPDQEQEELVTGIRLVLGRYYTNRIDEQVRVLARLRYRHILAGRWDELRRLSGVPEGGQPIELDGDGVMVRLPGHGELGEEVFASPLRDQRRYVFPVVEQAQLSWQGDLLHLQARTLLRGASAPHVRVALVRHAAGPSRPPLRTGRAAQRHGPGREVRLTPDGTLTWSGDVVANLGERQADRWALRLQLDAGEYSYSVPVVAEPAPPRTVIRDGAAFRIHVEGDADRRVIITCVREPMPRRTVQAPSPSPQRRLARRAKLTTARAARWGARVLRTSRLPRGDRPTPVSAAPQKDVTGLADGKRPGHDRQFRRHLDRLLQERGGARVALLGHDPGLAADLGRYHPQVAVTTFDPAVGPRRLHVELAAAGPYDIMVVAPPDADAGAEAEAEEGPDARTLIRSTYLHLVTGGVMLVRGASRTSGRGDQVSNADGIAELVRLKLDPEQPRRTHRPVASTIRQIEVSARHAAVTVGDDALAKLDEGQVGEFLELRPRAGRELISRPGGWFGSRATVRQSRSNPLVDLATGFDVPEVTLREYRGVLCAPGQVAALDNVMLPDSFRHIGNGKLGNRYAQTYPGKFGRPLVPTDPAPVLEGAYFYLDSEFRGHFGHAMTEQLSRLWAWREAKERAGDLKLLLLAHKRRDLYEWEKTLYAAAGVDAEDIVLADTAVRVEQLYAATPMFSQPDFVHPELGALWSSVGATLAADAPDREYPARFFCARRHEKRACRNAREVEEFFARRGFDVVYPEDYSLHEQAAMFRKAEIVGGYGGSALFNMLFADRPTRGVVLSSDTYTAQNEYLIASALGHALDVIWGPSEEPRLPGEPWSRRTYHAPFSIDLADVRKFLDETTDL